METPRARSTSTLVVEQVHDFLQILRCQPRVDRRRLDVGVTQMLLHRTKIAAGALEQLDAARVAERMRVDGFHADALAEVLDNLPDSLTQAIAYAMAGMDRVFRDRYPGYKPITDWATAYDQWTRTTLDTLRGSLGRRASPRRRLRRRAAPHPDAHRTER